MRLPENRIKEAILHPDRSARQAAAGYFDDVYSRDAEVMPLAIQAIDKYGRNTAFQYIHVVCNLAQTEATVDWVVRELRQAAGGPTYLANLSRVLLYADPRLLVPRRDEILHAPGFEQELMSQFRERLELLSWDADRCWAELERLADEGKGKVNVNQVNYARALHVLEALARQGEGYTDRILSLLGQTIEDYEDNPMAWMECFLVALAGEMRLQPAIPHLVRRLHEEGEILHEECLRALAKIGTDEAARLLADGFPGAEWHYRLYASDALGNVHSDVAVQRILDLLPAEQKDDIRSNLGHSLLANFATEAVEVVRQMVLDRSYDPMMTDLPADLVAACKVMDVPFPEMAAWEKEAEEKARTVEARMRELEEPPPPKRPPALPRPVPVTHPFLKPEKKVGRNDPCPCGSGKKFKHCCLKKA
jgi:hypothetical protein